MATVDDDRIDEWVRAAAPAVRAGAGQDLRTTLAALSADVVRTEPRTGAIRPRGESRRRRRVLLPLAAGAVLATAAAGFAQWYDTSTADFSEALTSYTSDVPLPPGTDRQGYVTHVRAQGLERPGQVSDTAVRSMVAYYGVCSWLTAWDARTAAGDGAGADEALTALRGAVGHPALAVTDGGGVVANLREVADAAAAGDRDRVAVELRNNCVTLPLDGIR